MLIILNIIKKITKISIHYIDFDYFHKKNRLNQ